MNASALLLLQVGQPTAVTNALHRAAVLAAAKAGFSSVLGALGGPDGLVHEHLAALTGDSYPDALRYQPGVMLGTDDEEDADYAASEKRLSRMAAGCRARGIGAVLVTGGAAGAALAARLSEAAPGVSVGYVPADARNAVGGTHHCLGYGTAAKKAAADTAEIARTIASSFGQKGAAVCEWPENETGWLAAAASLARCGGARASAFQYLPESPFDLSRFVLQVLAHLKERPYAVCAVSHGLRLASGQPFFPDRELTENQYGRFFREDMNSALAYQLRDVTRKVVSYRADVTAVGFTRVLSAFDLGEAEAAGALAVSHLASGGSFGLSLPAPGGAPSFLPLSELCGLHPFPADWYDPDAAVVREDFAAYALPLLAGEAYPPYAGGLPDTDSPSLPALPPVLPPFPERRRFVIVERQTGNNHA